MRRKKLPLGQHLFLCKFSIVRGIKSQLFFRDKTTPEIKQRFCIWLCKPGLSTRVFTQGTTLSFLTASWLCKQAKSFSVYYQCASKFLFLIATLKNQNICNKGERREKTLHPDMLWMIVCLKSFRNLPWKNLWNQKKQSRKKCKSGNNC